MAEQIKITINQQEFEVDKGARLIDVCREKGFGIPSFCYYKDLEIQASWLHDIFVEPTVRGSGVGESLLESVKAEAMRLGANKVLLSVALNNIAGQNFFERLGFRTTMLEMMLDIDTNND